MDARYICPSPTCDEEIPSIDSVDRTGPLLSGYVESYADRSSDIDTDTYIEDEIHDA